MATNLDDFTAEEQLFFNELLKKGDKVEVSYDLQTVNIDGVNVGTFVGQQSIYASDWAESQDIVTKGATKLSGINHTNVHGTVTCSATNDDQTSVMATKVFMDAIAGQTDVDILFSNGNTLTIVDDADMTAFLAVWAPFRTANNVGYTYESAEY